MQTWDMHRNTTFRWMDRSRARVCFSNTYRSKVPSLKLTKVGAEKMSDFTLQRRAETVDWLVGLPVAFVFVLAGWSKWSIPVSTVVLVNWLGVPRVFSLPLIQALAGFELGLGLAFIFGWKSEILSRIILSLLLLFSGLLCWLWISPTAPNCACFGDWISGTVAGNPPIALTRNAILVVCIYPSLRSRRKV